MLILSCFGLVKAQQSTRQDTLRELMRRLDVLTEEIEKAKLGEVAEKNRQCGKIAEIESIDYEWARDSKSIKAGTIRIIGVAQIDLPMMIQTAMMLQVS